MGDYNSQVGKREESEERIMGHFGYAKGNNRGKQLICFCQEHDSKTINGFFEKRVGKRWSWIFPNLEHKALINYEITSQNNNSTIDINIGFTFQLPI